MLFSEKPVAVVFDWDKTLSPRYQQHVLFEKFNVDEKKFWELSHNRTKIHTKTLMNRCIVEHEYLNLILDYTQRGIFAGLNNAMFRELGRNIEIYPGVEDLFYRLNAAGVEIYIVSGGIRSLLMGVPFVEKLTKEVYAADFADYSITDDGTIVWHDTIQSIMTSVIPTDKTRVLNEISKGCKQGGFDTNVTLPQELRRIPFKHMIYVGDGVSDIHAFETVRRDGGHAIAVYNPEEPQFEQAEMLRQNNWVDLISVADYRQNTTVSDWILQKVSGIQFSIRKEAEGQQQARLDAVRKHAPRYIHAWDRREK